MIGAVDQRTDVSAINVYINIPEHQAHRSLPKIQFKSSNMTRYFHQHGSVSAHDNDPLCRLLNLCIVGGDRVVVGTKDNKVREWDRAAQTFFEFIHALYWEQ